MHMSHRLLVGIRSGRLALSSAFVLLAILATFGAFASSVSPVAQQERSQEVVANLASGRVLFCVTRDAIIVAVVEGGGEAGSRPPAIVPIGASRIGVVLGASEWNYPGSGEKTVRLDAELPQVAANALRGPAATGPVNPDQAGEIENIGIGFLELLRSQVSRLHNRLDLAPDEPLVELLLADYVDNYGPEIWSLQYRIRQEPLGGDYWHTRPLRPAYLQLYPPEKGAPRTFVEVAYPANPAQETLIARLASRDPRLEAIRNSSPEVAKSMASVLKGESHKARAAAVTEFLRSALPILTNGNAGLTLAILDPKRGFQWVLAPEESLPAPTQTQPREPGAPTLRRTTRPR